MPDNDIYSSDNVLLLTNPEKFQNTTQILGTRRVPAVGSNEFGAVCYFIGGYVFRGDGRPPNIIFNQGFVMRRPLRTMRQLQTMTGSVNPYCYTGLEGVSATICADVAARYCEDSVCGCVYLIDAAYFTGFAIPSPAYDLSSYPKYPILPKLCEVCFMHSIPNSNVVGVVWPENVEGVVGQT
ncbi:hypothetical protein [Endozoicomonas euniceicola]|uniref:Uncharacterized protein n=1 Tax=Endozoicomonas euniceicola TaxID=1234143 RepID=A0ABY6GWV6_9GAMM|nr:hypothetical protein [Endozoicomonas euniceicola]UYM17255.1 hypothetical protein NX720_04850 [Endozoicomonas euniceicola]